jgi:hypothetical protein
MKSYRTSDQSNSPQVTVTLFRDQTARSLKSQQMTMEELAAFIKATKPVAAKNDCGWLKLAAFGDKRSEKGSLRRNANVTAVYGVMGDYDGEEMPMQAAVDKLHALGLEAVLYTSASHTADAPRWRVIVPLREPLTDNLNDQHRHWTEVLNAILGGVLKSESFTLSQSYFYGPVEGRPDPEVVWLPGVCLDELADPPEPMAASKGKSTSKENDRSAQLYADVRKYWRTGKQAGTPDEDLETEIYREFADNPHVKEQKEPRRAIERCIDDAKEAYVPPEDEFEDSILDTEKSEPTDAEDSQRKDNRSDFKARIAALIDEINSQHALIWVGGRLLVMWPERFEGGMPRLSALADVKVEWRPKQLGESNPINLWVKSKKRRTYDSIVFRPGTGDTGRDFNLFRGWGVQPDPTGDCSLFLDHLRVVICNGDDRLYEYVIQWLANSIQRPEDKPGTAITMQSDQGAGKGMVATYLSPIYGDSFGQLSSSDMLLGRFNKWLAGKILVFADEAKWTGRNNDRLKALITEQRIMVEQKFVDPISIDNYVRFIFATNHALSTPAEVTDRRFVVLKTSNSQIGNTQYWNALVSEREERRGPAALLHYLQNVKLNLNLRTTPKTESLAEQKLMNLDDVGSFWREMLMAKEHHCDSAVFKFGSVVQPSVLHACYLAYAKRNQIRQPVSLDSLAIRLREYLPKLARRKSRADDRYEIGVTDKKQLSVYDLPTLAECRRDFEKRMGHAYEWPDNADDADDTDDEAGEG